MILHTDQTKTEETPDTFTANAPPDFRYPDYRCDRDLVPNAKAPASAASVKHEGAQLHVSTNL